MRSTIDPPWPALRSLALTLDAAGVEWRLGGSALLAALGLTEEVGDLDVTVSVEAIETVLGVCSDWVVGVDRGEAPAPWCSEALVTLRVDGTEVDVIGGFCVRGPGGPVAVPQDLGGHLDVDGVAVPLADPAVWWWVYRTYRPAKAALLAEVVSPERRRAIERRLGPPAHA